ncbi:hypothetical protein AJ80_03009 [Polytolypa hystricis UAMH7299]|uniref:Uncharacterized protein n=1 Tax=Polytolypa hystricis (strain UAMH7299) TaxID=1447883 RepID=A0A2B7YP50_POLH7|nr:hypothetical protein AJ80_03009 [Polytolypa hystricis UAMH7299]
MLWMEQNPKFAGTIEVSQKKMEFRAKNRARRDHRSNDDSSAAKIGGQLISMSWMVEALGGKSFSVWVLMVLLLGGEGLEA